MCEADVFIRGKGEDEYKPLLASVDKIIPTEEGLMLESVFGEQKILKAKINEMCLVDHKILLEHL
jgi:predicted RNA-binding protein